MAWDKGFNFRETSGFVADGVDETYVFVTDTYPVVRNGVTFGWTTAPFAGVDQNAGIDRRLAGINYQPNSGAQAEFQVDLLQPGDCTIRLALGHANAQGYQYLQVKDDATPVLTIDDTAGTGSSEWDDAAGTGYSDAVWPGSNFPILTSFLGSVLKLLLGSPSAQTQNSTLAHFFASQTEPEVQMPTRNRRLATQQRMAG